jgi:carbamoyl-phosphate synthase large subunit
MNVLLSCAGRRNYLVDWFRRALAGRGAVLAADASAEAPAMQEADKAFVLPPVHAPEYPERLAGLCAREKVGLLLSLNDFELPVLAAARERLLAHGTVPVISSPEVIALCQDKWETFRRLGALGFAVPRTWLVLEEAEAALARGELSFPVILKPRCGTGSQGVELPGSLEELRLAWKLGAARLKSSPLARLNPFDPERGLIVQERLAGREHGLDVVNDLDGRFAAVFVKRKLAMRSGETDRAVTVEDAALEALGRRLSEALGHRGNLDCDAFACDDGVARVLELNPRFGGGYPFSHAAGADVPAALVAWALGEAPAPQWLRVRPGQAFSKCDRLVAVAVRSGAA